jgi:mRNA-degrading endonuclease toxin of MazEF toxin-antitoxin module
MLVRCLDKRRVLGRYGSLGEITMARVDAALRISTGLTQI